MKILAIRGRNLASLRGDFAVDLAADPLASAGLFAITGATGAGKSTLLDALCLALFDRTPRLDGGRGAKVGRADQDETERVAARDVRGLLTRGEGSGFAEVDFTGRDGSRWRARWAVRRAREQAGGRLQKQELTLEGLDTGDQIGGTKTEVLDAIRARVGLSFDQFRRSVLLAQGDFAAFLHAAAKARAELLEKVTGTAIYARVSEAAFARAKREREACDDLVRQRDQLGLLAPEAREELEQRLGAASVTMSAAKQAREGADVAVRWYAELGSLRGLEEAGAQAHQEALAHWQGTAERRATLDRVKAAQPLRAEIDKLDDARRRRDEAREQVANQSDLFEDLGAAKERAVRELDEARRAQEFTRRARDEQAPVLARATALDARLLAVQQEVEQATELARAASARAEVAEEKARSRAAEVAAEKQKRDDAVAWLAAHPDAQVLSGAWDHVESALGEHAEASRTVAAAARALPARRDEAARSAAAAEKAAAHVSEADAKLAASQQAVAEAEGAIAAGWQEQLARRRQEHERRRDAIRDAASARATTTQLASNRERAKAAGADAEQRGQTASEDVEQLGKDLAAHAIRLDEAERALHAAQATVDLEDRRAELVEDEPCPLCGATDHPYRRGASPGHEPLAAQRERVQMLRDHGAARMADLATAEARVEAAAEETARQARAVAECEEQMARPASRWHQARATLRQTTEAADASGPEAPSPDLPSLDWPDLDLPSDPLDDDADAALATAHDDIERAQAALEQQEAALRAREELARKTRRARDDAQELLAAQAASSSRLEEQSREAAESLATAERLQRDGQERLEATLRALSKTLYSRGGWRQQLEADPGGFRAACREEVARFGREHTARDHSAEALAGLEPRAAQAAAEAVAAREAAEEQASRRGSQTESLASLNVERQTLLDGQAVAMVEQALHAACTQAEQRFDAASEGEREQRAAWKAAEARLEAARTLLRKESAAYETATSALQDALRANQIDLETLRARLAHDVAWCEGESQALDEIRHAVQAAETVLTERRQRRTAHEAADRPEIAEDEAAEQQKRAIETMEQADAALQTLQLAKRKDDDARARGDALAAEIAQQEARFARWEKLNEVIGSHDGQKFRKFAQGLTLDSLLGYANVHLRDLTPRYHLDRVPGEDLELQVIDRDMGDEIRAINSLSGGETFLASLALALGLSSLSASDTPVESLFIDEGFGTLDLKTLETALSALDALQASGRQVGVISHVQDLGQRIGAQVRVTQLGGGRSRVETVGGF